MTSNDDFLKAILASPEDDLPRLVYADWLDDNDEPHRAEFIRVQVELARDAEASNDPQVTALRVRERDLIEEFGSKWLADDWPEAAGQKIEPDTFRRGFVSELRLRGQGIRDSFVRKLTERPHLGLLSGLDLNDNRVTDLGVMALAESPRIRRLEFLDLSHNWMRFQEELNWASGVAVLAHINGYSPSTLAANGYVGGGQFQFHVEGKRWEFRLSEPPRLVKGTYFAGIDAFRRAGNFGCTPVAAFADPHVEARWLIRRCLQKYRRSKEVPNGRLHFLPTC